MDVDNIPVGRDFEEYLKSQVAACDAMLAIIGPNWLAAKDETGKRRLDSPDDFIVIEIGTALTRNIPVVPVLVDGARMPKASELPDSLKLLARRQAIQVRHTSFSSDAAALVKKLREALDYDLPERRWRAIGVAVVAVLLLIGVGGYAVVQHTYTTVEKTVQQQEAVKAEQERPAKAAAEADEKRKAEEAARQRLAAVMAEEDLSAKAAAEAKAQRLTDAETRYSALGNPASLREQAPAIYKARFDTSKGVFVVEVTRAWAPKGADRFYNLVKIGFYDNVRFFRVISGFIVQFGINGDPAITANWRAAQISDDPVTQSNMRGMITFAAAGTNTRISQVFINFANNSSLDSQGLAPFGQVIQGMDVVDKLNAEHGDGPGGGPDQRRIQNEGNAYLMKDFPRMVYVKRATIER